MYDLTNFTLSDMTRCGAELRKIGSGATSMEDVANHTVQYLYHQFGNGQLGHGPFVLVRFFKTHPFAELPEELRDVAAKMVSPSGVPSEVKCLTLLATMGSAVEWQSRQGSMGHQAIPLVSEQLVAQSPMISQLIRQFGLEIGTVLAPDPELLVDLEQRTFNVFHVPDAVNSPYVPAQREFVEPYGIRSVLGFGGMLPSGDLMAIILFSKIPIARETADMFKTLALNVKMAILPFDRRVVFASENGDSCEKSFLGAVS